MTQPDKEKEEITVRLVTDHDTGYMWFEELVNGYQGTDGPMPPEWVRCTENMSCEGNARHELQKLIDARRERKQMVMRSYSPPESHQIDD